MRDQAADFCLVFFVQRRNAVMSLPYFEEDDPKAPQPLRQLKKRDGWAERSESRKDSERDGHRHVHVRC